MPVKHTIPHGPADVTAPWLAAVLDAAVESVTVEPVGTGQTGATYRAHLRYRGATTDQPATVIVKLPSQDESVRERVSLGYRAEHAFYRDVAHTVAVPLPTVYHCEIDREGADFVLVMDDLAPATQGDQFAGCDPASARVAVEALAGLHGPRWCDPAWLDFPAATMGKANRDIAYGMGELARVATQTTLERLGAQITPDNRDTLLAAAELVEPWLLLQPDRFALLHGDYRLDNMMFDSARGTVTIVDWQTLSVGLPARDLSYFLATSLQPEQRRQHERQLVTHYHDALREHGVREYSAADCWVDYRVGLLQTPLLTTLGFAFAAATDRGDDMVLTMLARGCDAIRAQDALALIREREEA